MRPPVSPEDREFFRELGERIKSLRKTSGLTQAKLGNILDRSQQEIQSFEIGKRRIPASGLPSLAEALGVSVEELLGLHSGRRKPGPVSKLEQQMKQVLELSKNKQHMASKILEGLLETA